MSDLGGRSNGEPIAGAPPSIESQLWFRVGQSMLEKRVDFLNDVQRQLLTLAATLLAGSLAFLDPAQMAPSTAKIAVALLGLSLAISLLAILPIQGTVDPHDTGAIERYVERLIFWRRLFIHGTAAPLALALGIGIVGYLIGPPPS